MKLTKLMLSAFAAALALVACNKVETDPVPQNTSLKSVKISLENVIMTKGEAGDKIKAGDAIQVNNFKIFLTDDSYSTVYPAKQYVTNPQTSQLEVVDAQTYFTVADLKSAKDVEYHFVDHKCTRVIAVANLGDVSIADAKAYTTTVDKQQDQKSLVLWADSPLGSPVGNHDTAEHPDNTTYTEVYQVNVALKPVISRFEVDGFVINFSTPTPKYNKIEVTDIAFIHYFPSFGFDFNTDRMLAKGTGTHVKPIANYDSQSDVFNWFNGATSTGWFRDSFTGLEMTPDDPATAEFENRADTPKPLAYHFFSGEIVPAMFITLLADGNPAYVYTSTFKSQETGQALAHIEPGKIYRMSAAGEVDQVGGSVPIPDDLDPIKRCLDITVSVEPWVVDLITPEF